MECFQKGFTQPLQRKHNEDCHHDDISQSKPSVQLDPCNSALRLRQLPDNLAANRAMMVERIDSRDAKIETVQVRTVESGLTISGRLRKKYHGRGSIPGHLHIRIIDRNGELLAHTISGYQRRSVKTRRSSFSTTVPVQQGEASIIEVIHHGLSDKHG